MGKQQGNILDMWPFFDMSYLSLLLIFKSVSPVTTAFMESSICLIALAKRDDSFIDEAT